MADEVIPLEHGKKLAEVIPGATGLWLEGVGHVFPAPDQDALVQRCRIWNPRAKDS